MDKTKAEQYTDAIDQVMIALANDHLDLAAKHIRAAQYVRYDLDTAVMM